MRGWGSAKSTELILADDATADGPATVARSPNRKRDPDGARRCHPHPLDDARCPAAPRCSRSPTASPSWALIGALVALLLGAALWAVGSHTQNLHQSMAGRRAVLTSLVAAVLIGAAPSLINFFFNTGLAVH